MITVHVFTHGEGVIESLDRDQLELDAGGLVGEYSTRLMAERADAIPIIVSPYQAKMALVHFGMYPVVLEYIKNASVTDEIRVKWEYSNFSSTDPDVVSMLIDLGVSDEQKAALFEYAMGVT